MTDNEYQIYWREQFEAAQREIAEMTMRQAILVAALKRVEWYDPSGGLEQCPWCVNDKDNGHKLDCARQLALECCKAVADENEEAEEAPSSIYLTQYWT